MAMQVVTASKHVTFRLVWLYFFSNFQQCNAHRTSSVTLAWQNTQVLRFKSNLLLFMLQHQIRGIYWVPVIYCTDLASTRGRKAKLSLCHLCALLALQKLPVVASVYLLPSRCMCFRPMWPGIPPSLHFPGPAGAPIKAATRLSTMG